MEGTDSNPASKRHPALFPVVHSASRVLSPELSWADCDLEPGVDYRLIATVEGAGETQDIGALVAFDLADPTSGGTGLRMSTSDRVPPHIYFRTGPGLHRTDRMFAVNSPAHRLGVMAWHDRGPVTLKTLTIEPVTASAGATNFFLSFDVEANPSRALLDSPIESLVWGRINGGEYGIGRICDVLEEHGVVGNFLVDFGTCGIEGEKKLAAIVDYLAGRGHEIHMHLHPDRLAPAWGLAISSGKSIQLDGITYEMSRRLLDFTVTQFDRFARRPPRVFRSGAYRMNADLVLAAGSVGIEALTNVRRDKVGDPGLAGGDLVVDREPFVWDNGVVELPVDSSSPEAGSLEKYLLAYDRTIKRKRLERTYNIVMHSFSLMRRNADGVHDAFEPAYEERLHEICEHATRNGRVRGYGEYLDEDGHTRPVVRLGHIRDERLMAPVYQVSTDVVQCNICDIPFDRTRGPGATCPACGLGAEHRCLRNALDNYGNRLAGQEVLVQGNHPSVPRVLDGAARIEVLDWAGGDTEGAVPLAPFDAVVMFQPPGSAHSTVSLNNIICLLRQDGVLVTVGADAASVPVTLPPHLPEYLAAAGLSASAIPGFDPVTRTTRLVFFSSRAHPVSGLPAGGES